MIYRNYDILHRAEGPKGCLESSRLVTPAISGCNWVLGEFTSHSVQDFFKAVPAKAAQT